MKHKSSLESLMKSYGFYLHRSKNHLIWKNQDGITITTSKTPTGVMAIWQVERSIKRILKTNV